MRSGESSVEEERGFAVGEFINELHCVVGNGVGIIEIGGVGFGDGITGNEREGVVIAIDTVNGAPESIEPTLLRPAVLVFPEWLVRFEVKLGFTVKMDMADVPFAHHGSVITGAAKFFGDG